MALGVAVVVEAAKALTIRFVDGCF